MIRIVLLLCVCGSALAEPWARHCIDDSSRGADGVRLYDVNGDGLQDVVTGWEEGGVVRVYKNLGNDGVKERWPMVTVGEVNSVEDAFAADLNGDGQADVVSFCEGNTEAMYIHWAPEDGDAYWKDSAWETMVIPASEGLQRWMFGLAADVNRDGRLDIIAAGKNEGAAAGWFEAPEDPRDGDGWTWHPLWDLGWVMSMMPLEDAGGEFEGFILSNRREPWRGLLQFNVASIDSGAVEWTTTHYPMSERECMFMSIHRDEAMLYPQALVAVKDKDFHLVSLEGHGAGGVDVPIPDETGTGKAVAWGDMDLDGVVDMVFTCEHAAGLRGVMALLQRNGRWEAVDIGGRTGTKFDRIELIDLDGDGDLDLMTCEEREGLGVIWYENPVRP